MPRVTLPPTPVSSADITGQKGTQQLSSLEMSFLLPPPAIAATGNNRNSSGTLHSQSTITSADFSLPPPPTRSRKIIQMKPKSKQREDSGGPHHQKPPPKTAGRKAAPSTASNPASKKQPSLTSAAGKKMARKTAHSVIERRRRSKMNEEFSVLKDMIPACKDQDMHKLAILQVKFLKATSGASLLTANLLRRVLTIFAISNNASPIFKPRIIQYLLQSPKRTYHPVSIPLSPPKQKKTKSATMTMAKTRIRKWQIPNLLSQHLDFLLWMLNLVQLARTKARNLLTHLPSWTLPSQA